MIELSLPPTVEPEKRDVNSETVKHLSAAAPTTIAMVVLREEEGPTRWLQRKGPGMRREMEMASAAARQSVAGAVRGRLVLKAATSCWKESHGEGLRDESCPSLSPPEVSSVRLVQQRRRKLSTARSGGLGIPMISRIDN